MIYLKTKSQVEAMRQAGHILASIHQALAAHIEVGISGVELDVIAEKLITQANAAPAFKNLDGYPKTLCVNVNDVILHGIPNDIPFENGDLVSIDCGLVYQGWYADATRSYVIGGKKANPMAARLIEVAWEAFEAALSECRADNYIGDMSYAIEQVAFSAECVVIEEMEGHGIGRALHEDPPVPNKGTPGAGALLVPGMTLAVEPVLTLGDGKLVLDADGWTLRTADGSLGVQVEETIVIETNGVEILTK